MLAELDARSIRLFRLHSHHLAARLRAERELEAAGACGLQNTPPGAWEAALFNRVAGFGPARAEALLYAERALLQAWSFRGAPVVFPVADADAFLSALAARAGEEWIYTHGIFGALDYLGMGFGEVLGLLRQVLPGLDGKTIVGKSALDQCLAEWILPLLPAGKRELWNAPSMYGRPDIQTVGGAAVSFLLRPCAFLGLVVFGARAGASPAFTSYKGWVGGPLVPAPGAERRLVRKFLHCYGPATAGDFAAWLGCGRAQAERLWAAAAEEMEPAGPPGGRRFILSADRALLADPPAPERPLMLLGGHDPYLDGRDRRTLLADEARQRLVWQTVSNPGAVVHQGEIIGVWSGRKKGKSLEVKMTLWESPPDAGPKLRALAEEYAAFRGLGLAKVEL